MYPSTKSGVGRIEISAKGIGAESTGSIGLANDNRFPAGEYTNTLSDSIIDIVWSKAVYFSPQTSNDSDAHFFDFPEMVASTDVYNVRIRQECPSVATGLCSTNAISPPHGSGADYNYNVIDVQYSVSRLSGMIFDSSMEGVRIRFTNIEVVGLNYFDPTGKSIEFSGQLSVDFVAKIRRVVSINTLILDRPIMVSGAILSGRSSEDTPYIEESGTTTKAYVPFNETDLYSTTARASGIQTIQTNQVYNVGFSGVSHLRRYYITSIKSANFEIVYLPRSQTLLQSGLTYVSGNPAEFVKRVCVAKLQLSNLRTMTGDIARYRVLKRSLNYPETFRSIAEGTIYPHELLYNFAAGEDFAWVGRFYNLSFAQIYWLTSGLTYTMASETLMDSIRIQHNGSANQSESDYLILKNNVSEPGRTATYIPYFKQPGSWWGTDPKRFVNFTTYPNIAYNCSIGSPYNSSIEVFRAGSQYNSNFVKLVRGTMYELSMNYAAMAQSDKENYELDVYFITSNNGIVDKVRLGIINTKTTRGFTSGTYKSRVFIGKTMYGTIQIVPKYITSVCISDISLKPFSDRSYSQDSAEIIVPLDVVVKNERIELMVELMDAAGNVVYGQQSNAFGNNRALQPLRDVVNADPAWLTLTAFDKS